MKFDAEMLCDSILQIMQEGGALNAKINAVEAEKIANGKGLAPALQPIDDTAYYYQTWTDKILNSRVAIFYGIEDVQSVDGGGAIAKTYKIFVEVVLTDNQMTNDAHKRIHRYARALEELFLETLAPAIPVGKLKIDSVRPISFKLALDSDEETKVGGVTLTITLY